MYFRVLLRFFNIGIGRRHQFQQQGRAFLIDLGNRFIALALLGQSDDAQSHRGVTLFHRANMLGQLARGGIHFGGLHHLQQLAEGFCATRMGGFGQCFFFGNRF